jgi:hypothetical protein
MSGDDVFNVIGTATKRTNGYSETKEELDTALGKAHADAHVLAELECSRLPHSSNSRYIRTRRVGPPSRETKTITLEVEDEFKCMDKSMEMDATGGDGHPDEQTQKGEADSERLN